MNVTHKSIQEPQEAPSDLLNVAEAAAMLRLKVSTVRAWVLRRQIPFVKLGGKRVFFRRADLEALISASIVQPRNAEQDGEANQAVPNKARAPRTHNAALERQKGRAA